MTANPPDEPRRPVAAQGWRRRRLALLLAGIGMVWMSALFFRGLLPVGLFLGGILLAFAAWVGMAALGWRSGLASAALVVVSAGLLMQCAPALHRQGLRMYIQWHRAELTRIVDIMKPVKMRGRNRRLATCEVPGLPPRECAPLTALMRRAGVVFVWKEGDATTFELYGWLNDRGGIRHCPGATAETCARRARRIEGDWFAWDW
jgi:hypothetical protein